MRYSQHDMKTYTQLTPEEQTAAFNYHLNSLIPVMSLLADCTKETAWQSLDEQIAIQTPIAKVNAESAIYDYDEDAGIMMPVNQLPAIHLQPLTMVPVAPLTIESLMECV